MPSPTRWTAWRASPTRTCSTSGGSPSCSATTARSTRSTIRSPPAGSGSWAHARDYPVPPRGFRSLARIPRLPRLVVQNIVREFRGLDEILAATDPELESVEGGGEIRAKDIREGLRRLQEINLVDRYLQT